MAVVEFRRPAGNGAVVRQGLLTGASIEVMPRTAAKIADFATILPRGTRVFIAHIDGTPVEDMVTTARRLRAEGMEPVPHVPARLVPDAAALHDRLARYRGEADVQSALVLAGGIAAPRGTFDNSMQLLETGAFDRAGITNLYVAGHPEGSRDIDPAGGELAVMAAARWKAAFAERTGAHMAMVTQFAFDAGPILDWTERLHDEGIALPVHVGLAGPARLQTLIKFAIACGVGPSLRVLQRRAKDVTKLLVPFEPTDILATLADHMAAHPDSPIAGIHMFPLGGIAASAAWLEVQGKGRAARQTGEIGA